MRRSSGEGAIYRKTGYRRAYGSPSTTWGDKRKYLYHKTKKAVADRLRARLSSGEMDLAPRADAMLVGGIGLLKLDALTCRRFKRTDSNRVSVHGVCRCPRFTKPSSRPCHGL